MFLHLLESFFVFLFALHFSLLVFMFSFILSKLLLVFKYELLIFFSVFNFLCRFAFFCFFLFSIIFLISIFNVFYSLILFNSLFDVFGVVSCVLTKPRSATYKYFKENVGCAKRGKGLSTYWHWIDHPLTRRAPCFTLSSLALYSKLPKHWAICVI